MANAIVKQFMAYLLLVVGYLLVWRYTKLTSDVAFTPPTAGPTVDGIASAIIELTENMEYVHSHASFIPAEDEEAIEEVLAWMTKAEEDLHTLIDKYIQESRLDLTGKEFLEVQDRRGRQVRLSIKFKDVEEFPDEMGYKKEKEVLQKANWISKDDEF